MKAYLMHPARNFDADQGLPGHEGTLRKDLELDVLLKVMANDDDFVLDIARRALLLCFANDVETIRYRHDVLWDSLKHPDVVRQMYALTVEAIEGRKRCYWSFSSDQPSSILHGSVEVLQLFVSVLQKMRVVADAQIDQFGSRGLCDLFAMLRAEFSDEYLSGVQAHLKELKFRHGVLLSAQLGSGNEGTHFMLRRPKDRQGLLKRVFGSPSPSYTFRLHERDMAGAQAVGQMRNRGINRVANALAQSMDHIMAFFQMLRTELAFYVGCLNLEAKLEALGRPVTLPNVSDAGIGPRHFSDLYDPCLALSLSRERNVVGNTLNTDKKHVVIITGANQGGKSSFLRSVGVAQLMMQSGMFVAAGTYAGALCHALYTHYKREEDATMKQGKLDEELGRMSDIAQEVAPDAMVLFNESFASTNEMEGAEIARQITTALLDRRIVVYFVTHLYTFAHGLLECGREDALFLRAERLEDGTRTFRLVEGAPLETSYGQDLYQEVFEKMAGT